MFVDEYMRWEPEDAVAVETCSDVMVEQDYHRITIYVTKDETVREKVKYFDIPEMLRSVLGLPVKAKEAIYAAVRLDPSLSSSILDEMGIAQLSGTAIILPPSVVCMVDVDLTEPDLSGRRTSVKDGSRASIPTVEDGEGASKA